MRFHSVSTEDLVSSYAPSCLSPLLSPSSFSSRKGFSWCGKLKHSNSKHVMVAETGSNGGSQSWYGFYASKSVPKEGSPRSPECVSEVHNLPLRCRSNFQRNSRKDLIRSHHRAFIAQPCGCTELNRSLRIEFSSCRSWKRRTCFFPSLYDYVVDEKVHLVFWVGLSSYRHLYFPTFLLL